MNRTILLAVVVLLGAAVTSIMGCREARLKARLAAAEQNVAALSDSVRYERNKAGEIEAVRRTLAADKNQLKTLNASLHAELVKERGKVKTITRTVITVERDTVEVPGVTTRFDSVASATFAIHDVLEAGERHLEGQTDIWPDSSKTTLTRDELSLTVVAGIREKDGHREMFARTGYPGVTLNVEGAEIDPQLTKPRRKPWGVGPSFTVGVDPNDKDFRVRYLVGVSLTRSVLRF